MTCVACFVESARQRRLVRFIYRKHLAREPNPIRVAEPYTFAEGKQDLMIRCYQIEPEEGWRFFMAHKLDSATMLDDRFHPRRTITLPTGEVDFKAPREEWTTSRRAYRDLVSDAMADGTVGPAEFTAIREHRAAHALTDDDIRFVHASLTHRCLGAILDDGEISEQELLQIRFVFGVMSRLGWAPSA